MGPGVRRRERAEQPRADGRRGAVPARLRRPGRFLAGPLRHAAGGAARRRRSDHRGQLGRGDGPASPGRRLGGVLPPGGARGAVAGGAGRLVAAAAAGHRVGRDARPDQDRARGPYRARRRHLAGRGRRDRPRAGLLGGPGDLRARSRRPGRRSRRPGRAGRPAPAARAERGDPRPVRPPGRPARLDALAHHAARAGHARRGTGRAGQPGRGRRQAVRHPRLRQPRPARPRRHRAERDGPPAPRPAAVPLAVEPRRHLGRLRRHHRRLRPRHPPPDPRRPGLRRPGPTSWPAPPSTATSTSSS